MNNTYLSSFSGLAIKPTFRTSDNSAVKTAADVAKPAYAEGRLRQRGLEISVREGGLRITSGDFSR